MPEKTEAAQGKEMNRFSWSRYCGLKVEVNWQVKRFGLEFVKK